MAGIEAKAVNLLGMPVPYAYAVKAGKWIFLTGHEAFDFESGVPEAVAGPPGFPLHGRSRPCGLRSLRACIHVAPTASGEPDSHV